MASPPCEALEPVLENLRFALSDMFVGITTYTLCYGLLVLLFFQLSAEIIRKSNPTKAHMWTFFISALTFLIATVRESTLIAINSIFIQSVFGGHQDISLVDRIVLQNHSLKWSRILILSTDMFGIIAGDGIVIWRAFVLLQNMGFLIVLPAFLLTGSIAMALACLIGQIVGSDTGGPNFFISTIGLSLGTNVVSTALIGYVYWFHSRSAKYLGGGRKTQVEWVLIVLLESGILFCSIQAVNFALQFPRGDGSSYIRAQGVLTSIYYGFAALYPTLVVLLVNNHQTLDQMFLIETSLPVTSKRDASKAHVTLQTKDSTLPAPIFSVIRTISRGANSDSTFQNA